MSRACICLAALLLALPNAPCFAAPGIAANAPEPTREGVLALADKVIAEATPELTMEEKGSIDGVLRTLASQRTVPTIQAQSIDELLNLCTLQLASTDGLASVIVLSGNLVKLAPANARTSNLLGAVLHAIGRNQEAIASFEYARTLAPKSELVMLNAANTYLDLDEDARAKDLIDKVIAQNGTNKSAWSALALYWYKRDDFERTLEALVKASSIGGYVVQQKTAKSLEVVAENETAGADSIPTMETKLEALSELQPATTADLIEDEFPDEARRIRDHALRLIDNEKMIMPPLPQVNTSGLKNWKTGGLPYIKEWAKAFGNNAKKGAYEVANLQAGINPGDSKKVKQAKGRAAAQEQIQKSLADAEQTLRMLEGMPGVSAAQIAKARAAMDKVAAERGIAAPPPPAAGGQAREIKSDEDLLSYEKADLPPGWDSGSVFAVINYRDFSRIRDSYLVYFQKYYKEHTEKALDIQRVYNKKYKEECDRHEAEVKKIEEEAKRAREAATKAEIPFDGSSYEFRLRAEAISYKKAVNTMGELAFAQWVNLALPQYAQKMKPRLDEFWSVCALYIRNMNDLEVMKAEYIRAKQAFWMYAGIAVSSMGGGDFVYLGDTAEEEAQLLADMKAAEEIARLKAMGYERDTKAADNALVAWLEDNFALGIAGEFLSLKLTPRRFTVEEYIAGMNFKHVFDFKTGEWTTYRSFAAKIDVGIQVGPLKAGVSARADILESYDTINVRSGQVVNSGSRFATGTVSGTIGDPNVGVSGSAMLTLDPAAESELSVKFGKSLSVKGKPAKNMTVSGKSP